MNNILKAVLWGGQHHSALHTMLDKNKNSLIVAIYSSAYYFYFFLLTACSSLFAKKVNVKIKYLWQLCYTLSCAVHCREELPEF